MEFEEIEDNRIPEATFSLGVLAKAREGVYDFCSLAETLGHIPEGALRVTKDRVMTRLKGEKITKSWSQDFDNPKTAVGEAINLAFRIKPVTAKDFPEVIAEIVADTLRHGNRRVLYSRLKAL